MQKTAEPIEMPFEIVTQVGPRNHHLLDGCRSLHGNWAVLGVVQPIEKHYKSLMCTPQQKIDNGISATDAAHCIANNWPVSH